MSKTPEWRTVRIGLLMAGALVVMAMFIMGITSQNNLFERKATYYSRFPDAAGLKEGSSVWFQGVEVGFISSIEFNEDPEIQEVIVRYRIGSSVAPRIRTGSRASIRSLGLLGDKFISLSTPKDAKDQAHILPGHEIRVDPRFNLEELGRGAQDIVDSTIDISHNLKEIIESINAGEGALARLLKDPELGKETMDHLSSISRNLDQITCRVASGEGFAGKVLADRSYGDAASRDLAEALARANGILGSIQEGEGGAGAFLAEGGSGEEIVVNLAKVTGILSRVAESFEQEGTLGNRLFMDPVYGEELARNILSISESLDSILKKIDSGEGSLGALVNDRQVYDTLAAVAATMNQGKLVKWYMKRNLEKEAREAWEREGNKPHGESP